MQIPDDVETQDPEPNPYRAIVRQQPQDPPAESLYRQHARQRRLQMDRSFAVAVKADPDLAGEAQRLGIELGLDPLVLERNMPRAKQMVAERRFRNRGRSPVLDAQLQDHNFARIAHDAHENLAWTERILANWEAGQLAVERGILNTQRRGGDLSGEARREWVDQRLKLLPPSSSGPASAVARFGGQMSLTVPEAVAAGTAAATGTAVASLVFPPSEVLTVPTAFAMGFLSRSAIASYQVEGGNAYADMLKAGYDEPTAHGVSIGVGLVNAALETVGTGIVLQPFKQALSHEVAVKLSQTVLSPARAEAVRQAGKEYVSSFAGEVTTELMQEVTNIVGEEIARHGSNVESAFATPEGRAELVDRLAGVIGETARGMALLAAPGPLLHLHSQMKVADASEQSARRWQELLRAFTGSEVRKRNPRAYESFVKQAAAGTGAEILYVDGETFLQSLHEKGMSIDEVAQIAPDVARQAAEAAIAGGDVVIPVEQYASRIVGSKLDPVLQGHVRFRPEDVSPAAQQTFRQGLKDDGEEAQRLARESMQAEDAFAASAHVVQDSIHRQLAATKLMPDRDAETLATLFRDFVVTQAARQRLTPEAYYAQHFPLQILRGSERLSTETFESGSRGEFNPRALLVLLHSKADASTVVHEFGHAFLHIYGEMAAQENAPSEVTEGMQTLLQWFGVKDVAAWRSMSVEEQRRHHEAFAQNFETYLSTGEAPSPGLRAVFQRVAQWLRRVYRSIRGELNADYRRQFGTDLPMLTPEVRAVFDRMLASEDQIAQMEAVRNVVPLFTDQAASGMNDAEWASYMHAIDEAKQAAVDDLSRASLREMQWLSGARSRVLKELQGQQAELRAGVRDEVAAELEQQPVYRALAWLATGAMGEGNQQVGGVHKLNRTAAHAMFPKGEGQRRQLAARDMLADDGVHPDVVATVFGFPSGQALVEAVLQAPEFEAAVDARTDERMLAEHGELQDPKEMELQVEQALHNEARTRFVALELRAMARATQPVRLMMQAAREAARRLIAAKPIREIRPRNHALAEARAANEAAHAQRSGDPSTAIDAKRKQLLQSQLAAVSLAAREEVRTAVRSFDKVWGSTEVMSKTRDVDLVMVARAILTRHGLGSIDGREQSYLQRVAEYDPELWQEVQPLLMAEPRDYRDLTLDEFRAMKDTVELLWFKSRRNKQVLIDGKLLERQDAVAAILEQILQVAEVPESMPGETQAVTTKERIAMKVLGVRAALRQVEHWAWQMDGQQVGPVTLHLWRELRTRVDDYRAAKEQYVTRLRDLIVNHDLQQQSYDARELGYTFASKAELLGAILHSGNESNLGKNVVGRKWGEAFEEGDGFDRSRWDAFFSRMLQEGHVTKADMDLVQAIWDLNEELLPQSQAVHHALYGRYFEVIPATPIATPFGTYRGGYVPAHADPEMVPEARQRQGLAGVIDQERGFRESLPAASKAFTISRLAGYRKPLVMDVTLEVRHLDEALRFIHTQPAIRDVLSLIRDPELAEVLNKVDPSAIGDMLLPWLERTAKQSLTRPGNSPARKVLDPLFTALRRTTGVGIMFANVANAAQQLTGISNSSQYVEGSFLNGALSQYLEDPTGTVAMLTDLSRFMDGRLNHQVGTMIDELELALDPSWWGRVQAWTQDKAYFMQRAMQSQVDIVTWLGAYDQAMARAGVEATDKEASRAAVAEADGILRLAQGSTTPEDVAGYQVGTPFARLFTQFSGYWNTVLNQVGSAGPDQRAQAVLRAFIVPTLASAAIYTALAGSFADDDEDGYADEASAWLFGNLGKGTLGLVPGFGPAVASLLSGDRPGDRLSLSPALSSVQSAVRGVGALLQRPLAGKDITGQNVRDLATAMSMASGVPFTVVSRPAGYLTDVGRGTIEPSGPVDAVRGVLTGR